MGEKAAACPECVSRARIATRAPQTGLLGAGILHPCIASSSLGRDWPAAPILTIWRFPQQPQPGTRFGK